MAAPTLTPQQLAATLDADYSDTQIKADIDRVHAAAVARIAQFRHSAPVAIANEALVRLAGFFYDIEPGAGTAGRSSFRESGAQSLLSPFRTHRAVAVPPAQRPGGGPVSNVIDSGAGGVSGRNAVIALIEAELAGYPTTDAMNAAITVALSGYVTPLQLNAAIRGIQVSGGALTANQAKALNELETFEAAIKHATALVTNAAVTVGLSDAAVRFPEQGGARPKLPENRFDRELLVTVGLTPNDYSHRFYIKDLENTGGTNTLGVQLTALNAIRFTDSRAAVTYSISYHTTDRELLFSADTVGRYRVTVADYDVDIEEFARRSQTASKIPAAKLPTEALEPPGLNQAAVDARIAPFARATPSGRIAEAQLPADLDRLMDALDDGGWMATGPEISVALFPDGKPTAQQFSDAADEGRFAQVTPIGPRRSNIWVGIAIPSGLSPGVHEGYRVTVGGNYSVRSEDWEAVGTPGATDHWLAQISNIPAGDSVTVERLTRFHIDTEQVATLPAGGVRGQFATPNADNTDYEWRAPPLGGAVTEYPLVTLDLALASQIASQTLHAAVTDIDLDDETGGTLLLEFQAAQAVANAAWGLEGGATVTDSSVVFLTALKATDAYAGNSATRAAGILLGEYKMQAGLAGTTFGTARLYVHRTANGSVGIHWTYDPAAGQSLPTGTVRLRVGVRTEKLITEASSAPPVTWASITGKPATFPPTPTPLYTSLAGLPAAANRQAGEKVIVAANTAPFEVMEFMVTNEADGARNWKCVAGTSRALVNINLDVTTSNQWVAAGGNWDFRFPKFIVSFGAEDSSGTFYDAQYHTFASEDIEALTAQTAGAARTRNTGANTYYVSMIVPRAAQTGSAGQRFYFLGRTATNGVLFTSAEAREDAYPLRIRGTA